MHTELLEYSDGEITFEAFVAHEDTVSKKAPCVILCHAWAGPVEFEQERAVEIAKLGYVAFLLDVYGKGVRGTPLGDNMHMLQPLLDDRALLLRRLTVSIETAKKHARVDTARMAAIGYCFGGLCVLDIARSANPDIKGVASFHGLFYPPNLGPQKDISAKVLILHGYEDPMATPEQMLGVATELTQAKADWEINAYGHAMHAFTAAGANLPERGLVYNANANRRSWVAMKNFLEEVLV